MSASTVMQHATHTPADRPRFFVSARGVLMDRQGNGPARRLPYSMERNRATRSEMQILADMLNEPEHARKLDAGDDPAWDWSWRISLAEEERRTGRPIHLPEACHA